MRVECARCGHSEDDTYEFDMPFARAQAMEDEPGKCPQFGAPIQMHLSLGPVRGSLACQAPVGLLVVVLLFPLRAPLPRALAARIGE